MCCAGDKHRVSAPLERRSLPYIKYRNLEPRARFLRVLWFARSLLKRNQYLVVLDSPQKGGNASSVFLFFSFLCGEEEVWRSLEWLLYHDTIKEENRDYAIRDT